jgi:hypothetical protein
MKQGKLVSTDRVIVEDIRPSEVTFDPWRPDINESSGEDTRRRRRRRWTIAAAAVALIIGAEVFLGVTTPVKRTTAGSIVRSGGPVLPGQTGLHIDAFVGNSAYVMNLDTGQVRSAVAIPYGYLGGFNNFIPRAGGVFLELSFGRNFVMPDDLQSVRSVSMGYSAPALRPDAVILVNTSCPPHARACTARGNTQEVEVTVRGQVLRSLPSDAVLPIAEGTSGLVVDAGRPDRRLELLDQAHGSVVRSLGYAWEPNSSFAAIAGSDRLVWMGSSTPRDPRVINPPSVAFHITDLHTGADVVVPNPPGLLPWSLAVDPRGDQAAVLWRRQEASSPSLGSQNAFLGIVDLATRQVQPVPGASRAADPLVWAPRGKWLFFGTARPSSPGVCGYANELSAYKVGARTADPLSVPHYVIPRDACGLQMTVW